jgi:hypothetical protein
LVLRHDLLLAELRVYEHRLPEAREMLAATLSRSRENSDSYAEMRVMFNLTRIAWLSSDWSETLTLSSSAMNLASHVGCPVFVGRLLHFRASTLYELGNIEDSERTYAWAASLLTSTEDLRYRALVEAGYAGFSSPRVGSTSRSRYSAMRT